MYGYLPYWEMTSSVAGHVAGLHLTTLVLFSVTETKTGRLDTGATGYRRITGSIGQRLVRDAHRTGVRAEVAFTSFGLTKNHRFFAAAGQQEAAIADLATLARSLGADGINVDVEQLDPTQTQAYAAFVGRLRATLTAELRASRVTVATGSGPRGATMASAVAAAGAAPRLPHGLRLSPSGLTARCLRTAGQ